MSKVTQPVPASNHSERSLSTDPLRMTELYRDYVKRLQRYFANKVPIHDVDDLVQLTFVELLKPRGPVVSDVRAYVFGVARHILLRYFRRAAPYREIFDPDITVLEDVSLSDQHLHWVDMNLIADLTKRLSDEQREILHLHYVDEKTTKEISETLEIPLGTVYSRLRLARKNLSDKIDSIRTSGTARPDKVPKVQEDIGQRTESSKTRASSAL